MPYSMIKEGKTGCKCTFRFDLQIDGRRFRKQIRTYKSDIKSLYREWEHNLERQLFSDNSDRTIFELIDQYMEYAKSIKKSENWKRECYDFSRLKQFLKRDRPIRSITKADIQDYYVWRFTDTLNRKGHELKVATRNREICTFSFFFNWCIDRGYIEKNVTRGIKQKEKNERIIILNTDQIQELYDKSSGHLYMFIAFALNTGMRFGELKGLKVKNIDLMEKIITLDASTKSGRGRTIYLPDDFLCYVKEIIQFKNPEEYVFTFKGKPINSIRTAWLNFRKRLSFGKTINDTWLRFHDLRHVYGTVCRMNGIPDSYLMNQLGHSSFEMTQRYAHIVPESISTQINKISRHVAVH